jgi:hypothetical protein
MSPDGSVTCWLALLQAGEPAAVQPLWERYFRRLVSLARKLLDKSPRAAADEEDVALSAFNSFCREAEAGRFPRLADRDSLWRLLVVLTAQCLNYLKATGKPICLLLNFGKPRLEVKRFRGQQ